MKFKKLKKELQKNFKELTKEVNQLYEVEVDRDEMWNLYLDSFPTGTNEIFRERRKYDCNCCKRFIRDIGNAVVIQDGKIKTIWDFDVKDDNFQVVINALDQYVKSKAISDVYVSKFKKIGIDKNNEMTENGKIINWEHFYLELPNRLVDKSNKSTTLIKSEFRVSKEVFKSSLEIINEDSIITVLELIEERQLNRGEQWKEILEKFLEYKKEYLIIKEEDKDIFLWVKSVEVGSVISRIKNHSIGVLLIDLSEGVELNLAIKKYLKIVDPENYQRVKTFYTKKMIEQAEKDIIELGFMKSLGRRYANLNDITINNILFCNKDSAKRIIGGNIFDEMKNEVPISPKKFNQVEEIHIDKFIQDVLPTTNELEVFLENKHTNNMVSLIAPINSESKTMFKWDNNFGWAYTGNITDSSMKERVKALGGTVDGVLRASLQWNENGDNEDDLDLHCVEPNGNHIEFPNKGKVHRSSGMLDVDIINPNGKIAVENIIWTNKNRMEDGVYKIFVNNYTSRNAESGFKMEIEFDGNVYSFEYNKPLRQKENIYVAEVKLKNGVFSIKTLLSSTTSSKEIWGLNSNQFYPVSVICYSPNYWNENKIGNKHLFFMLKGCINSESPNGFFNEYLKEELRPHRKVFEALGNKMAVNKSEDQLSGLGFSFTKRNDVIIKIKNPTERTLKIKF